MQNQQANPQMQGHPMMNYKQQMVQQMGQMNQMNQQVNPGMPMGQMNQGMQVRQQAVDNNYDDSEYMESKVYTCTACGAELMINNVETSTFCAYCGQPTIVFNRVSRCRRPRYIIPFSVTKDQALSIIRQNLSKGDYVPDEVKHFKVEMLRGIYIPFWLFDIRMRQRLLIRGQVGTGDDARTAHFYRDGEAFFNRLTVDASVRFNDESSQRLEPYIVSSAVPFNEAYLSGFYADCGDDAMEKMDSTAVSRASNMLSYEIRKSVRATEKTVEKKEEIHQVSDRAYALLPAWFLVFKNDNQFYTLMVNGQTGKMIGAVPSDKKKVTAKMTSLSIIFAILGGFVGLLAGMLEGGFIRISAFFVILIFTFFGMGNQDKKAYERSKELTTEKAMEQLVAERNGD